MPSNILMRIILGACLAVSAPALIAQDEGVDGRGTALREPLRPVAGSLSVSDQDAIHEAVDAHRHVVTPTMDGHVAHNPGQQWTTRFDGRGISVQPDAGDWKWGLELQSYGFAGAERAVQGSATAIATGQRLAYEWSDALTEWFINDRRGLEHGFTVQQRPEGSQNSGRLLFRFGVRGALKPEVEAGARGVRFMNEAGATILSYAGLVVFDADGRPLEAGFDVVSEELLLSIDEREARYPLTIDPVAQQPTYLKASNTGPNDLFGVAIAISGDTVVVGASNESSNAIGVDGDQSNNNAQGSGAAYVFVRSGSTWTQQAYIKASNTGVGDDFGNSVAISGDTIVIGAWFERSNATGVNGDQSNDAAPHAGAAYVFVRNGSTWSQQAYLKASNTSPNYFFGISVAISGDTIVVGSRSESSNATGVNGDQNNSLAPGSGAAYVFVRSGGTWTQQAYLKASNSDAGDRFGESVSVSGNTIVIGAYQEDSVATGVNGDQSNNAASNSGAAYVFVRNGTTWSQQAYIKASNTDAGDQFGRTVSVFGDTVVIGAPGEDSDATDINGDQSNNSAASSGAAYVFGRTETTWVQQAYLKSANSDAIDILGISVGISEETVVVGASLEDSNATGVNGDQNNNAATDSGAAYVFVRNGATWVQSAYLKASNTDALDQFGQAVAISDGTVVVGAFFEDSNATGVDGDGSDNSMSGAGAAYVYRVNGTWTNLGFSLPGASNAPRWHCHGALAAGSLNTGTLQNLDPHAEALLLISTSSTPASFAGGTLVAFPWVGSPLLYTAGPSGEISVSFVVPPGVPPDTEFWTQWVIVDDTAPFGLALSNAIRAQTP